MSSMPHSSPPQSDDWAAMDQMMNQEREEMDNKVRQERATVDLMMNQEREKMYGKLKHLYEETDKKLKLEREAMDEKLNQEREAVDRALKQERRKMDKEVKKIHKDMDEKLQRERDEMDLKIEHWRAKIDCKNMQALADTDQKLQKEREEDYKTLLKQVQMEAKMMQDLATIDPKATTYQTQLHIPAPDTTAYPSTHIVVMEFSVHVDGEISYDPRGYFGGRTGFMIFNEPAKVEWWLMVENLRPHGYKGNTDLYYVEPGCVPPDGMVLISGPEHVEQMMQAYEGRKKCDLYIVRNGAPSDDSNDGMSEEGQYNDQWDYYEDCSSPRSTLIRDLD